MRRTGRESGRSGRQWKRSIGADRDLRFHLTGGRQSWIVMLSQHRSGQLQRLPRLLGLGGRLG